MLPINVRVAHGCHCNRRTLDGIRSAGFEITSLERDTLKHAPPFIRPLIVGVATRQDGQAVRGRRDERDQLGAARDADLLVDRLEVVLGCSTARYVPRRP